MSNRAKANRFNLVQALSVRRAIKRNKVSHVAAMAGVSAPQSSLAKRAMSYLPKGWTDLEVSKGRKATPRHGSSDGQHSPNVERIVDVGDAPMRWEREGPCLFDDCQQDRRGVYAPRGPSWSKPFNAGLDLANGLCLAREALRDDLDLAVMAWAGVIKTYDHKGRVIDCRLSQ